MSSEYTSILDNHTFDLVPPHPDYNLVDTKWIFRTKYLPSGNVDKFKAWLVAKGYKQQPRIDYNKTFSPVIKATTIRTVLNVVVARSWPLHQIDINNAFLQGTLTEEVYVAQPLGFVDPNRPTQVCKLRKALYSLKQAPRAWYLELKKFLLSVGFQNSVSDASLFILCHGTTLIYILIYVDDIIVTGSDVELINRIIQALATRFSVKDLGELSYFLGIEAIRTRDGLHLNQRKYVLDLLTKYNMDIAKPVLTPMATNVNLSIPGEKYKDPTEYHTLIGSLQYLSFTRPDIAFLMLPGQVALRIISQQMHTSSFLEIS